MRQKLIAIVIGLFVAAVSPATADTKVSNWVADIPIMPELNVEQGLGFAYENTDGRVVTIILSGEAKLVNVIGYYSQALEPLGWEKESAASWTRNTEILKIESTEALSTELIKISIRPR